MGRLSRDLTEARTVWGAVSAGDEALGQEAPGVLEGQQRSRWAEPLGAARRLRRPDHSNLEATGGDGGVDPQRGGSPPPK